MGAANLPHVLGKSTGNCLRKLRERLHEYQETQTALAAIKEFVFGTKEALPAPTATELASPAPTPTLEDGLKEEA